MNGHDRICGLLASVATFEAWFPLNAMHFEQFVEQERACLFIHWRNFRRMKYLQSLSYAFFASVPSWCIPLSKAVGTIVTLRQVSLLLVKERISPVESPI